MTPLSQSPTDPDFVQNPYPFYDRARGVGPFFHWEDYGHACAASHGIVNTLLRDRRFGRENPFPQPVPDHLIPFYDNEAHSMLEREPPTHTRLRGLVMRAFTSRRIAVLEPEIAALSHQLIDGFTGDEVDLLPAYCEKIPVVIICRLLGVPEDMADQLLGWSHDMVAMYQANRNRETEDRAVAATLAFQDYIRRHVADRRRTPGDDLITHLIAAEEAGERLSTDELITTCILLLNAGHEATVHALGNGVKAVIEAELGPHLSQFDPVNLADEVMRFDPPLHMFTRFAMEDVSVAGHDFAKGEVVGLLLAAANHDPAIFTEPNRFDPERNAGKQLALGAGLHFCVGAPLARLEVATALPILFDRMPELRLSAMPRYANRYHFHGLERLFVST
ncbi:cytochrome P450 [Rubricella aquisinus]|uniref:Cytochrome P450 n=1 Tax=Rubricella aquisinus TaxID=2028108 RepID=A0A840WWH8_9RHOB|nr:cytochrome P450 [Rubricella aquisinus]MBB5514654.1 cytochrome P450 [Rubricella aquisinus]